jgi:hypothetical protein
LERRGKNADMYPLTLSRGEGVSAGAFGRKILKMEKRENFDRKKRK